MDLQDWRDLTFTVFASLMVITLILFTVAAAAGAYFLIKGLLTGRRKLAEARPTITTIRRTAAGAEVGATKVSDTVAMPFIKARGLANAVKEGARALVGARDDQP